MQNENETSTADSGGSAAVPGSLPPETCPHCGAEKSPIQPEQENDSYRSVALNCGSWWTSGPGSKPRVGRVSGCYERELATLTAERDADRQALATITKHWQSARRSAFDNAINFRQANVELAQARAEIARLKAENSGGQP
jgi:hypothetical protein